MKLTKEDIAFIKQEKFNELGLIFGSIGCIVFLNFLYIVRVDYEPNLFVLVICNITLFCVAGLLTYLINSMYYKDLKSGIKIVKKLKVSERIDKVSYEAGSGISPLPVLASIFPKMFSKPMNEIVQVIIVLDGTRYLFEKNEYANIQKDDIVEVHYGSYSKQLLKIVKVE